MKCQPGSCSHKWVEMEKILSLNGAQELATRSIEFRLQTEIQTCGPGDALLGEELTELLRKSPLIFHGDPKGDLGFESNLGDDILVGFVIRGTL